jgi:DnaJ-domain-containing protein 1
MAEGALSIKLRCASWQQLATIYKRDLSHGTMFLKATTPPLVGTTVRIDLALPSATVITLSGVVHTHVNDPQRGAGVELKLEPIPTGTVWLIESALASEQRRLATPVSGVQISGSHQMTGLIPTIGESAELSAAEQELIKALASEAESLKKLNPFLVLGVGYEASDSDVRAAFGGLTKRYHPDRFARYESAELRQVAAEIFILIRDAYRRLGDATARAQVLHALGKHAPAPRAVPGPPRAIPPVPPPPRSQRMPLIPSLPPPPPSPTVPPPAPTRPATDGRRPARQTGAPTGADVRGVGGKRAATDPGLAVRTTASIASLAGHPGAAIGDPNDVAAIEALVDQGRLDEALAAYKAITKRHPQDRNLRAGVELCEGLLALAGRDRLEAAQRFETALEIDPSNERAARELADMRRQATNERKGLLSRLMGKKEP